MNEAARRRYEAMSTKEKTIRLVATLLIVAGVIVGIVFAGIAGSHHDNNPLAS